MPSPRVAIPFATRARDAVATIISLSIASYVLWVLAGTVAWISHLGHRAPWSAQFLLARGFPGNEPSANVFTFLASNVPAALGFVLPHSLLPPKKLYGLLHKASRSSVLDYLPIVGPTTKDLLRRPGSGRLIYNLISAGTLHFLLRYFSPLTTPIVAQLPFPETFHMWLSVAFLGFAMVSMVFEPQTYGLLGVGQTLKWHSKYSTPPPNNMDAITWMGVNSWRGGVKVGGILFRNRPGLVKAFGGMCFVLFTGVSILPATLTFGDCLTRGIAAFYLRKRSKSFRKWVVSVEGAHLVTWAIRAGLLFGAFRAVTKVDDESIESMKSASASSQSQYSLSPTQVMGCAAFTALVLRLAENHGKKVDGLKTEKTKVEVEEIGSISAPDVPMVEVSFGSDVKQGKEGTEALARRSPRRSFRAA